MSDVTEIFVYFTMHIPCAKSLCMLAVQYTVRWLFLFIDLLTSLGSSHWKKFELVTIQGLYLSLLLLYQIDFLQTLLLVFTVSLMIV